MYFISKKCISKYLNSLLTSVVWEAVALDVTYFSVYEKKKQQQKLPT